MLISRRRFIDLVSLSTLSALGGCTSGSPDRPGEVRLTVWSMWSGQEEKNFQKVLNRYQELNPGVLIENLGAVRDDTKTIRSIVAGVPPDVFTLVDPLYLGPLAEQGAISALDSRLATSALDRASFVPASLSQCVYKGKLYAMPFLIDDQALMWNKKAFREAGLDPERPPATLEELEQFVLKLTKKDGDKIVRLGMQPLNDYYLLIKLFGGQLYNESENAVTPDHPKNVAALTWYVELINKMGGYSKVNGFAAGFGQAQGANNPFFVGKVAMMVNGEWNPSWCQRYAPDLEYGVAPFPPLAGQSASARTTWLGGNMFCIPQGSKRPDEAWKLLVWMQSEEAQTLFANLMNNVPNQRAALKSPALRQGAPYKEKFAVFLDLADSPNAGHFPAMPAANLYNNEMITALDLVLIGEKSPQVALREVRERVQRELDRYR